MKKYMDLLELPNEQLYSITDLVSIKIITHLYKFPKRIKELCDNDSYFLRKHPSFQLGIPIETNNIYAMVKTIANYIIKEKQDASI